MKNLALCSALVLVNTAAFAYSGHNTLQCKSNSKATQNITLEVNRSNTVGWTVPSFELTVDGKSYDLSPKDDASLYGQTVHNTGLGVIQVTVNTLDTDLKTRAGLTVTAIPSTVKAYDQDGKHVTWSLDLQKQYTYDFNGSAKFQAVFQGILDDKELETQILDCSLTFDSGSAG